MLQPLPSSIQTSNGASPLSPLIQGCSRPRVLLEDVNSPVRVAVQCDLQRRIVHAKSAQKSGPGASRLVGTSVVHLWQYEILFIAVNYWTGSKYTYHHWTRVGKDEGWHTMLEDSNDQSMGLPVDPSLYCGVLSGRPGRTFCIFEAHAKVLVGV